MLDLSERGQDYRDRMLAFMDEHVYPAESVYREQMRASGDANHHPQVLEDLKAEARSQGLWNLFHPHPEWGPGLTNLEYAPLCEIMVVARSSMERIRPTPRTTADCVPMLTVLPPTLMLALPTACNTCGSVRPKAVSLLKST